MSETNTETSNTTDNYSDLPFEVSGNEFSPKKLGGLYHGDGDTKPTNN